jgi:hypothetical protein
VTNCTDCCLSITAPITNCPTTPNKQREEYGSKNEILILSPNPASLNVTISNISEKGFEVFDIYGRLVSIFRSINDPFLLNIEDYNSGIYFVISHDRETIKLIKY